jgi:hypothetical protein
VYGRHWLELDDLQLARLPDLIALALLESEEARG